MKYHLFLVVVFLTGVHSYAFGQPKLSHSDLIEFKKQARRKIDRFEYNIRQIIYDENNRNTWIAQTMSLFTPGATIQVAGKKSGISKPFYIEVYLNQKVPNYAKNYGLVVIEFTAVRVGDFKERKGKNGKIYYEAEIEFAQRFCRSAKKNDNNYEIVEFEYCDMTYKRTTVVLEQKTSRKGNYWQMLLGDITVESITD